MVQKLGITFLCALFFSTSFSQNIQIVDAATSKPISDVFIYHENKEDIAYTDAVGQANLLEFPVGLLFLQHPSFHELSVTYNGQDLQVRMKEKIVSFNEVVVSANKWEQEEENISQQILSVNKKSIQFQNPQTSADLLANTGEIFVQKSQLGGGSPKIRGFAANSVLLVVDGVRMNNAIFRSGNLQNIINIDANALESTEVIFGPGSVIYGSDALGGVMDFHTIAPKWSSDDKMDVSINALSRYSSAANERTGHLDLSLSGQKLTFFQSSSYTSFDDLRAGAIRSGGYEGEFERRFYVGRIDGQDQLIENEDVNIQKFSGYELFNNITKLSYRLTKNADVTYGFYYSTTSDIPRYDNLTQTISSASDSLEFAEWHYGPQEWKMHNLRLNLYHKNPLFDQARVTLAFQQFEESRNDRRFGADSLRVRTEKVDMFSASLDFDKEFRNSNLYYGVDFYHNDVGSSAFKRSLETDDTNLTDSRYPDGGSSFSSIALYGSYVNQLTDQVTFNSGIRYNYVQLQAKTNSERAREISADEIDLQKGAVNGSLGLAINLNKSNKISYNISTGFRSPNIDDVGKLFDVGSSLVVPNSDLRPEYSLSYEIAYQKKTGKFFLKVIAFHSRLFDAIVDGPFSLDGQDVVEFNGESLTVFSKVNTNDAELYGGSATFSMELSDTWAVTKTISYTGGRDITNDIPLRHTTPIFGKFSLAYQKQKVRSEFYVHYNGNRDRDEIPSSEIDRKSYLYTEEGTPGWYTLNLRSSYQINEQLNLNAGVENVLDRHYRPYTSGISAPGRNFVVALRANL